MRVVWGGGWSCGGDGGEAPFTQGGRVVRRADPGGRGGRRPWVRGPAAARGGRPVPRGAEPFGRRTAGPDAARLRAGGGHVPPPSPGARGAPAARIPARGAGGGPRRGRRRPARPARPPRARRPAGRPG